MNNRVFKVDYGYVSLSEEICYIFNRVGEIVVPDHVEADRSPEHDVAAKGYLGDLILWVTGEFFVE